MKIRWGCKDRTRKRKQNPAGETVTKHHLSRKANLQKISLEHRYNNVIVGITHEVRSSQLVTLKHQMEEGNGKGKTSRI
jgi:hypothetical protein